MSVEVATTRHSEAAPAPGEPREGAIKEAIFEDPDLPEDRDAALAYLEGVKEEVLSDDTDVTSE